MRTPAGTECRYFYGNYFRGRKQEECRLVGDSSSPNAWSSDLCKRCPVPGIIRANACPNMILEGEVTHVFFGLKRAIKVTAYCTRSQKPVEKPEIGCGLCHPIPDFSIESKKE